MLFISRQHINRIAQHLPWKRHSFIPVSGQEDKNAITLHKPYPCWGWAMLEINVQGNITHGVASVEIKGLLKKTCIQVPLRIGKTAKRLVWVPLGVRSICVNGINIFGDWHLRQVKWVWLTPWFAHDRLARRLSNVHADYSGLTVAQVKRKLHRESVAQGCGWRKLALETYDATFSRLCSHYDYAAWCRWKEPARLNIKPLTIEESLSGVSFSLLMPITEEPSNGIESIFDSIKSLWQQVYARWELCIVMSPQVEQRYAAQLRSFLGHCRRVILSTTSGSLQSALQQRALVMAKGDWVGWISPGDRLSSLAFVRMKRSIEKLPLIELAYSDEDIISASEERSSPDLKPEWNPDLLLSKNYLGRLALYRRTMLWRLEAYAAIKINDDNSSPEAFDYMRALRFLIWWQQSSSLSSVVRVPGIFYHRHEHNANKRNNVNVVNLVQQYFNFQNAGKIKVTNGLVPGSVKNCWPLPEKRPLVTLIVPTRDHIELLKPCVNTLLNKTEYYNFELIIIDNNSKCSETLAFLKDITTIDARVKVERWPYEFNYSAMNNMAVKVAKGSLIGLINNDVEPINSQWLSEMVAHAVRPDIGCVGAKLYYPEGMIQHAGVILGVGGTAGHAHRFYSRDANGFNGRLKCVHNVSAVTGACLLIEKCIYQDVGGLNENELAVAYNDVDFCLKVMSAGYRNIWTPYAELIHYESATRHAAGKTSDALLERQEADYMHQTWQPLLSKDPAYHPYLTLHYEDFSLV
ncbi:glycosyltransferase family 2 protein [Halomonas sp. BC1]|uniref:glycosyltransferase family 2 protein n=1 Tax=Halomonas sp. BC1 TaxID=1670448 RepID=UPI0009C14899|nr:glycosyltransferase family 2 protein [Halomonas sp. BC1]